MTQTQDDPGLPPLPLGYAHPPPPPPPGLPMTIGRIVSGIVAVPLGGVGAFAFLGGLAMLLWGVAASGPTHMSEILTDAVIAVLFGTVACLVAWRAGRYAITGRARNSAKPPGNLPPSEGHGKTDPRAEQESAQAEE